MKNIILLLLVIILAVSCTQNIEQSTPKSLVTTSLAASTTIRIATTSTTPTTTTTTTTFVVPEKGELCAKMYSEELNKLCGDSNVDFYIVAPELAKCHLGAKKNGEDVLYIEVTDYNRAPYLGLQPRRMPIWSLKSNLAYNETGDISARIFNDNRNEVHFMRGNLYVIVKTWTTVKPLLCTTEQTLSVAKVVDKNIRNQ